VDLDLDLHGSANNLTVLDPDPDLDPGAWKWEKIYKYIWFPDFKKGFCTFVHMFFDLITTSSIFFM
jgi:hypothetical protein